MINEIVTRFKFLGSLKPQEDFNTNLGMSIGLLAGMATGIQAAAAGMFYWSDSVLAGLQPLVDLQRETDTSIERLQELGYAASKNGSDIDAVTSSISNLSGNLQEFAHTNSGSAAEVAAYLGLSFRDAAGGIKSADVVMDELRQSMVGMADFERLQIMDKLGIDSSLLATLSLTNSEMDTLRTRAQAFGIITANDANELDRYNNSLIDMRFAMSGIQQLVAVSFAPMMAGLVEGFVDLLAANRDWIVNGLKWLGNVVSATAGFLNRMYPVLLGLVAAFILLKVATFGWGASLAVVFSPVLLITAAIVAVLLIIDDLMVAMTGGQSVIADFFMEFFGVDIVPIIQGLIDAFFWLLEEIKEVFAPLKDYFIELFGFLVSVFTGEWDAAIDHLTNAFVAMGELLTNIFNALFDVFTAIWDGIGGFITETFINAFDGIKDAWGNVTDWLREKALNILPEWAIKLIGTTGDAVGAVADGVSNVASYAGDAASNAWQAAKGWFSGGDELIESNTGGNSNVSTVDQVVEMNIYTNDAVVAGNSAADSLNEQLQDAKMLSARGGQ